MNTEQRFFPGDKVRFQGGLWNIKSFHGNRIYSVYIVEQPLKWEFAYEGELKLASTLELLTESIAQAKAKKGDA